MDSKKEPNKKYFDVAPPKPITAPTVNIQKRRILSKSVPIESGNTDTNKEVESKEAAPDTLMEPDENEVKEQPTEDPVKEVAAESKEKRIEPPTVDPLPGTIEEKRVEPEEESDNEKYVDKISEEKSEVEDSGLEATQEEAEKPGEEAAQPVEEVQETEEESTKETKEPEEEQPEEPKEEPKEDSQPEIKPEELTPIPEKFATEDSLPDPGQKKAEEIADNMQEPKLYDTKEYYVPIGKSHHSHGGLKGAFIFGVFCAAIVLAAVLYFMYILGKS